LGVQIFQITGDVQTHETFVIRDKKVFKIGIGVGGQGVPSICVADLNQDKTPELVYAYSWGSGVHRSHVAVFDCLAAEPREYVLPQGYFHTDDLAVKRVNDQKVEVWLGPTKVGQLSFAL